MKSIVFAALFTSSICAMGSSALAQDSEATAERTAEQSALQMRADQIVALLNREIEPQEVFTDGFLAAVPPEQIDALSEQLTGEFGPAIAVEALDPPDGTRASLAIRLERAITRGGIAIDPNDDNRVSELLFQNFDPIESSPAEIEADLAALPGKVTWWFGALNGSDPIIANAPGDQMPLGSTFKIYVLAALAREVADGKRSWDDVVTLGDLRSFPSGMMQDWPSDAPVTLETLASLMISISDNTATDALIRVLGRDVVMETLIDSGHSQPELNDPFLTTREMFMLKGGPAGRLGTYAAGDAGVRAQILDGLEAQPVEQSRIQAAFSGGPIALDVEWFGNAADLAALYQFMLENADLRAFEIMAINPQTSDATEQLWNYVGYKGGSEPGVLNLTWFLTSKAGVDHALILSWRNEDANLDQDAMEAIAQRILRLPQ